MKKIIPVASVVAIMSIMVTGCGTAPTPHTAPIHKATTQPSSVAFVPQTSLPSGVESHLSNYSTRIEPVSMPPMVTVPASVHNVVFIDAQQEYVIAQFQHVWKQLKSQPMVVWIGSTQPQTMKMWKMEGYAQDPLPSAHTMFSSMTMPSPASYHEAKGKWTELPGVLKNSQADMWMTFFN